MRDYVIFTDSSADLTAELVQELGVEVLPLTVLIGEKPFLNYPDNREIDPKDFYDQVRAGAMPTTSAVNVGQVTDAVEPILQSGKDVLFLAFSSGLSVTCHSARIAAEELSEKYPESKFLVVDSLCASLGQGLLVYHVCRQRDAGLELDALADWAESHKLNLCHWFTVDDLMYLKRGGRVSAATALVGTMLQIKPVLHVDDEGHLINVSKARGRKASIDALAKKMEETALPGENDIAYICHGDCLEDAKYLAQRIKERCGVKEVHIGYTGAVIGSHAGPGVLALFYLGSKR